MYTFHLISFMNFLPCPSSPIIQLSLFFRFFYSIFPLSFSTRNILAFSSSALPFFSSPWSFLNPTLQFLSPLLISILPVEDFLILFSLFFFSIRNIFAFSSSALPFFASPWFFLNPTLYLFLHLHLSFHYPDLSSIQLSTFFFIFTFFFHYPDLSSIRLSTFFFIFTFLFITLIFPQSNSLPFSSSSPFFFITLIFPQSNSLPFSSSSPFFSLPWSFLNPTLYLFLHLHLSFHYPDLSSIQLSTSSSSSPFFSLPWSFLNPTLYFFFFFTFLFITLTFPQSKPLLYFSIPQLYFCPNYLFLSAKFFY